MNSFIEQVRQTILRYRMLRPGAKVLAAVSGGPDSTVLLAALVALRQELKLKLYAAYVDHGSRLAAEREAKKVKQLGKQWGVAVHCLRANIQRSGGESWEEAARKVRYQLLEGLGGKLKVQALALGHTRDDQAETVLMWILRGAGPSGLSGIPAVRQAAKVKIIRPLIALSRQEVKNFLQQQGLKGMLDASNRSERFRRNKIRQQLLPLLEREFNPRVRENLSHLAELMSEEEDWLSEMVQAHYSQTVRLSPGKARMNRDQLKEMKPALRRRLLRKMVSELQGNGHGFTREHWERMDRFLVQPGGKRMDLPHRLKMTEGKGGKVVLSVQMDSDKLISKVKN